VQQERDNKVNSSENISRIFLWYNTRKADQLIKRFLNMNFISYLNKKIAKLDWVDIAFMKISCFAFGILLVFLIPGLMKINVLWIIVIWILFAIRPIRRFFR